MQAALEEPWSGHRVWTILDSDFGQGERFLKVCAQWRSSKQAPELLHYVAFCEPQYDVAVLGHTPAWGKAFGADDALGETAQTAPVMHPGFNRFLLQSGQISLTLCRGDIARMLSELRMQADSVFGSACAEWDPSLLCLLARNCKPGALLTHLNISANAAPNWTRNGFQLTSSDAGVVPRVETRLTAVYAPSWTVKNTRLLVTAPLKVGRCAVIGAGLGGASVAHALALRGWEVTVLDTLPQPASGASGLPAGLCVQQHSADHNPQSRLLDQGVRLSLGHARYWLKNGRDWCKSGVLEKALNEPIGKTPKLAKDTWHAHAGWVKPASLVRAWLNHPNIHFRGNSPVKSLAREASQWALKDAQEKVIDRADLVVIAAANGSAKLVESLAQPGLLRDDVLRKLGALQSMHGLVSIAGMPAGLPPATPVNGRGSVIPGVPRSADETGGTGAQLYAGASYIKDAITPADQAFLHAHNLEKLQFLAPELAKTLANAIANQTVQSWSGTRCVTHDRLPLVGPLDRAEKPSLWICTGMGSRGISLAALCAELLVACIGAEPLPLEASLAKSLSVNRPRKGRR